MKLSALIVAWIAYFIFVGPYLISADSWALVVAGAALLCGLSAVTVSLVSKSLR